MKRQSGNALGSDSLGRLTFGPKFSYSYRRVGGITVTPYIGIRGIWDFDKAEIVILTSGLASGSDDLRARAEGALSVQMTNGWSLDGQGFYDGIGSNDFEAYGGRITLAAPLQRRN